MRLSSLPIEFTLIICGMHRAGTSFIARVFHEWGVYLGPPEITNPDPANAEGEYENQDFVNLNNQLLRSVGGTWNYPKMVEHYEQVAQFEDAIKSAVDRHRRLLWGWKDNRTAFTFRAYEPFLKNPIFVVCVRDKMAVELSLANSELHADQFDEATRNFTYYGQLYDMYYAAIDEVSSNYPKIAINYEAMTSSKFFNPELRHFK